MRSSVVTAENFAGTTSPISLFLFPVAFANSLFSVFAPRKFFNKRETAQLGRGQQASSSNSAASCQWEVYKHQLRFHRVPLPLREYLSHIQVFHEFWESTQTYKHGDLG